MSNPKIQRIRLAGTDYDIDVHKDWQENDPNSVSYIENRTHYDGTQIFYLENIDDNMINFDALVTADCYLMPGTYTVFNWNSHTDLGSGITETVQEGEKKRTILDGKVKLEVKTEGGKPVEVTAFYVYAPDGGKATLEVTSLPKQLDPKYIPPVSELGGVEAVINGEDGNAVPFMYSGESYIAGYKEYNAEAIPETLVYRTKSTGAFNVVDATNKQHPVAKHQMDEGLATKVTKNTSEESKQTVYITDPKGNQSYKKYTSEAYPSTIAHREASLDTIAVADPLYDAHPVTLRFANERYFPIQKKHTPQQGWVKIQELFTENFFGPLEAGKTYKLDGYVFVATADEVAEGGIVGIPPENIFQYEGDTCPWQIYEDGRIEILHCDHAPDGNYSVGVLYELHNDLHPFATFTYQEVWDEESYMYESFEEQLKKWVADNLKHGQKVFTDLAALGKFDTTNVVTIVPDPEAADISKAANVICTNCSYYDAEGNPKVYPVSAAMYIQGGGYVYLNQYNTGYWRASNEVGGVDEYGNVIYPDTFEDSAELKVRPGATIIFYDVADYTQHVTSAVMIQDPQGNPSNKPYTQFAEYGTIPMRSTSGSPTFEVGDPVNEQNPVTLSYAKNNYEVKRGSSTGPNTVAEMEQADSERVYSWGGKYVRYYSGNGRFNVADPTGSLHPVNKRTIETTYAYTLEKDSPNIRLRRGDGSSSSVNVEEICWRGGLAQVGYAQLSGGQPSGHSQSWTSKGDVFAFTGDPLDYVWTFEGVQKKPLILQADGSYKLTGPYHTLVWSKDNVLTLTYNGGRASSWTTINQYVTIPFENKSDFVSLLRDLQSQNEDLQTRIKALEDIINSITTLGITKNDNGQLTITQ